MFSNIYNYFLSHNNLKIRNVHQLEKDGLILIGKGRCGTLITEKGINVLRKDE